MRTTLGRSERPENDKGVRAMKTTAKLTDSKIVAQTIDDRLGDKAQRFELIRLLYRNCDVLGRRDIKSVEMTREAVESVAMFLADTVALADGIVEERGDSRSDVLMIMALGMEDVAYTAERRMIGVAMTARFRSVKMQEDGTPCFERKKPEWAHKLSGLAIAQAAAAALVGIDLSLEP